MAFKPFKMGLTRNSETDTCWTWMDVVWRVSSVSYIFAYSWGVDEVLGRAWNPTHCSRDKLNLLSVSGIWTEFVVVALRALDELLWFILALPAIQRCIKSNLVDATKYSDLQSKKETASKPCYASAGLRCDMDMFKPLTQGSTNLPVVPSPVFAGCTPDEVLARCIKPTSQEMVVQPSHS